MGKSDMLAATLALVVATTACQPPTQEAGPLSEEDMAAIRAVPEAFAQAVLAGDWATVAAGYAEDAVFMPPNEPAVEGRAAIRVWWEASSTPFLTQFTLPPTKIDGRGDLAYVRGTYAMTIMPEGAPEPFQESGKYVVIMQKQPDGSWLVVLDIWNSDLPVSEQSAESEM